MKTNILVLDTLHENALQALFADEICVLQLKNFCESRVANHLAEWFLHHRDVTPYLQQQKKNVKKIYYGVDRIGLPFNSTYQNNDKKIEYYQHALSGIRTLRAACLPYLSPVDKLRVELDENWSHGVPINIFCPSNAARFAQPHWDSVPTTKAQLISQFSANIYLSVPTEGGELEIWPVPPIPTATIHTQDPNRDWRGELPPSILVKPDKGDLLLFNTRRPHAIAAFAHDTRIAVQFFIGLTHSRSLVMWT